LRIAYEDKSTDAVRAYEAVIAIAISTIDQGPLNESEDFPQEMEYGVPEASKKNLVTNPGIECDTPSKLVENVRDAYVSTHVMMTSERFRCEGH
jgi:hypothetical protein